MATERSLTDFASTERFRSGPKAWCSTLPEDIQQQIRDSIGTVSSRIVVRWLHELGYTNATLSKVEHFRRSQATA